MLSMRGSARAAPAGANSPITMARIARVIIRLADTGGGTPLYQLKITLRYSIVARKRLRLLNQIMSGVRHNFTMRISTA
jgi:hypothetical protein